MELELLQGEWSVCKLAADAPPPQPEQFCFFARTPDEVSLVCPTADAPDGCTAREDGWRCLRVRGTLAFSLTGVLSGIAGALAAASIPVFAVSTYDTDYILLAHQHLGAAAIALAAAGYPVSETP